ncbi:FAD-dependent oxidoreductase [Novosphingobium flavum]|uniref:FAD-dependent oxidoreductase n=1 Tax=Novosphingobium flavum TaxID=1778672 RepID=A0A7X1FVI2_9SPHN|nr:FAD-dependent oxidoreductase [Novosphingobium flavum]MBC2667147.1 FAD-dependent oxidoreductase [Novosphingobium flavum]
MTSSPPFAPTTRRALLAAGLAGSAASLAGKAAAQVAVRPGAPAINRRLPDVVVVGAGAFGGWTALALREAGARVTLVDAYGPGNPRASSGDESRLLRLSYGTRDIYTLWAQRAAALWDRRQQEFGRRMYYPNGSLRVMHEAELAAQRAVFDRHAIPYEVLGPDEMRKRWPQLNYDDTPHVFYESTGGVVKARESMIAVSEVFMQKGGEVRIGHARPGPMSGGAMQHLLVDDAPLPAGLTLFACGPWLPKVFPQLLGDRIRVPRRELFYVGSPIGDHRYRWEHLPNLADLDTYTASDVDYGIKVASRLPDTPMDPDFGARMPTEFLRQQVEDYVARRMPGLKGQPIVATRTCQTEYSDNSHFIIDRHPEAANVWIAGAGSGHAFKMGPVLGDYLRDRLLGRPTDPAEDALFTLASHKSALAGGAGGGA